MLIHEQQQQQQRKQQQRWFNLTLKQTFEFSQFGFKKSLGSQNCSHFKKTF